MTEDSMHASLDAALARNSGPSAEDVWSLLRLMNHDGGRIGCNHAGGRCSALSDWLAAHTAAAEARGAERGARAVVEAVEAYYQNDAGSHAGYGRAAREAASRVEGGA